MTEGNLPQRPRHCQIGAAPAASGTRGQLLVLDEGAGEEDAHGEQERRLRRDLARRVESPTSHSVSSWRGTPATPRLLLESTNQEGAGRPFLRTTSYVQRVRSGTIIPGQCPTCVQGQRPRPSSWTEWMDKGWAVGSRSRAVLRTEPRRHDCTAPETVSPKQCRSPRQCREPEAASPRQEARGSGSPRQESNPRRLHYK